MPPRLILVEGFPGNGKSATAQWLARQLGRGGHARWFYEEEQPHPVLGEPRAGYPSWKACFADWLGRWTAFAAEARASDTITILEPNVVEAESWPFRLTFLEVDGVIGGVRIDGPTVGQRRMIGSYEKTA